MRGSKLLRLLGLALAASVLVGGVFTGAASARTHLRAHHYTKAQKIRIRHQLAQDVKRNPRVVLKRWFMIKAGSVSYTLPVSLRFRTSDSGQPPTLNLDLGSLGVKSLTLQGELQAQATFVDPAASGVLGELRVTIPAQGPGVAGGNTQTEPNAATLRATPLAILTNSDVSNRTIAGTIAFMGDETDLSNVITNVADTASTTDGSVAGLAIGDVVNGTKISGTITAIDPTAHTVTLNQAATGNAPGDTLTSQGAGGCADYVTGYVGGTAATNPVSGIGATPAADPNLIANNPPGIDPNTVFRTPYLPIGVAGQVVQTPNNLGPAQPFTGVSGGTAYLFGNPSGGPGVDVTLNALTPINSVLRGVDTGNPLFIALGQQCRQTWTGYVNNVLTAHVSGSITIRPDVTPDGRLRLAVASLSGGSTPNVVTACDSPYSQFDGVNVPALTDVDLPFPSLSPVTQGVIQGPIIQGEASVAPNVPCGSTPQMGGAVNLYTGTYPTPGTLVSQLPGVQTPTPCGSFTNSGTNFSACEISLNADLTPGILTADVLVGNPNTTPPSADLLPPTPTNTPGNL